MKKTLLNLEEQLKPYRTLVLILALAFFATVNSCSVNKKTRKRLQEQETSFKSQIDSLQTANKLLFELEGYKISKRLVYDENTIVRTKQRPDDVMAEYDKKIEEIRKQLNLN